MTDQATRVVPAGWYQDPALTDQVRWWNGLAWTEHVRDKPVAIAGPATAVQGATSESTAERVAAARELERQFGISTSENEIISSATALGFGLGQSSAAGSTTGTSATGSSFASGSTIAVSRTTAIVNPAAQRAADERGSTNQSTAAQATTFAAWLIGLIPVFTFLLGIAAAYIAFYVAANTLVFVVAFAVPYLIGILWALGDHRALRARGFSSPSSAWALLGGFVYLIARRLRVRGSGPVALFVITGILVAAVVPVAGATGQLRPLSAALTIQSEVSAHYLATGQAVSVACPPFVDATSPGTLYTCDATTAIGTHRQVWVSIDDTNGRFSYSMAV